MATVSNEKYFGEVQLKKKPTAIDSYSKNSRGELITSKVVDNFLIIRNQVTLEYKKLFPVNQLMYLDFEVMDNGYYLFIVNDYDGLSCQIRNFDKGTLDTHKIEIDNYASPSIISATGLEGIYYSRDAKVLRRPYNNGKLGDEEVLVSVPGEYLEYAVYDTANSCVKLVTKVFNHAQISPNIIQADKEANEYTNIPLTPTLELKHV